MSSCPVNSVEVPAVNLIEGYVDTNGYKGGKIMCKATFFSQRLTALLQPAMFMALNGILKVVEVSITRGKNAKPDDEWSVSDGRSLTRFRDGMVIFLLL